MPVAADAYVHLVADQLLTGLGEDLEPVLVHVSDRGADDLQVGIKPLDGRHPSDLLVGFTAPPEWHALGVATRGFAYPIAERGSPQRQRTRVDVVALVSRTGELAHRVHVHDGGTLATSLDSALRDGPDDATGEQVDLLRLALGLGTDEPPCGSDVYWAIEWLSALLGSDATELRTWARVVERHPATTVLLHGGGTEAGNGGAGVDDFVEVAAAFSRVCTWTRIRSLVAEDRFEVPDLVPTDASWFDDGGFARFVLSRCPPLAMLRAHVGDHLDPELADRVQRTLDDLGVPTAPWPDTTEHRAA